MNAPGTDEEFIRLLTVHQGPVLAYIRSLMPGFSGAMDILQQTNLTLWAKKTVFEPGTNFKAWAFAIARNHVLDQRKRLKRDGWLIFSEETCLLLAEDAAAPDDDLDAAYLALDSCLAKLPARDLELVQKRYQEGVRLEDYARTLRRSAGTLKARLFKIRAALRQCVEAELRRRSNPA